MISEPKIQIAFLHTAAVHVRTFEALVTEASIASTEASTEPVIKSSVITSHEVHTDWLAQAHAEAQTDGLSPGLRSAATQRLTTLASESVAVICTCSTLGPIVSAINLPNLIRIDQPLMMATAARSGTSLLALCLDSTRQASTHLLEQAYLRLGKSPDYKIVSCVDAWPAFEAGNHSQFGQHIADKVMAQLRQSERVGCIALGQASMAVAQPYLQAAMAPAFASIPVYSSPRLAVAGALALVAAVENPDQGVD